MRTEPDLISAIGTLADDAPDLDTLLAGLTGERFEERARRRATGPVLAVAAAVAAVAGVIGMLSTGSSDNPRPSQSADAVATRAHPCATYGRPDLRTYSIGHVDGLADDDLAPRAITSCSGYSTRDLYSASGFDVGTLTVYRAGVFDTALLANAQPVSGHGIDGFELDRVDLSHDGIACPVIASTTDPVADPPKVVPRPKLPKCTPPHMLAWKYAPDSWAVISARRSIPPASEFFGSDLVDKQLAVAAAVDTEHPKPLRIPFAMDRLPDGVRVLSIYSYSRRSGTPLAVTVAFGLTGRPDCPAQTVCDQIGEVSLMPRADQPAMHGKPVTVDGRPAYLVDQGEVRPDIKVTLWTGTWSVMVGEGSDRQLPDSGLIEIAGGLRYASSATDRSTWFDVLDALPG